MTTALQSLELDPAEVEAGDMMSFTYYGKVNKVENVPGVWPNLQSSTRITLTDVDNDTNFQVEGDALIEKSKSADQYSKTQKVTKTEIVDILSKAKNVAFSVKFRKKDGSSRKLRGRLIGVDQKNLGYIDVEDLDKPVNNRFRLVDCRTIEFLIVNGVKYVV